MVLENTACSTGPCAQCPLFRPRGGFANSRKELALTMNNQLRGVPGRESGRAKENVHASVRCKILSSTAISRVYRRRVGEYRLTFFQGALLYCASHMSCFYKLGARPSTSEKSIIVVVWNQAHNIYKSMPVCSLCPQRQSPPEDTIQDRMYSYVWGRVCVRRQWIHLRQAECGHLM